MTPFCSVFFYHVYSLVSLFYCKMLYSECQWSMGKKSDIWHRSVYFEYYKYVAKYGYLCKWEECVTKTCYNLSIGGEFADTYNMMSLSICNIAWAGKPIAILVNNAFKTAQQSAKDKEDISRRADTRQRYLTQDLTLWWVGLRCIILEDCYNKTLMKKT